MNTQYTIQKSVVFEGVGLHTGRYIRGKLLPMAVYSGIQFQRIDLPEHPTIEAAVAYVSETERATILQKEQVSIFTVEHLLAAIAGLGIDNICIQLDGPEVPNLDGSALAFVQLLLEATPVAQEAARKVFMLKAPFSYRDPETNSHFEAYPNPALTLHGTIAYERRLLLHQHAVLDSLEAFTEEIAPARSFIYLDEIVGLYRKGLLQGGDPTKALIFSDDPAPTAQLEEVAKLFGKTIEGLVTPVSAHASGLRYKNEAARHKLLDLLGDLTLLGRPLKAKIWAYNPGHGANARFVAELKKQLLYEERKGVPLCDLTAAPRFDAKELSTILPHRYPFQLVDKIMHLDDVSITGVKNVTINEPFFPGHFPNEPIMPGVLQLEALAQTGGVLLLHQVADPAHYLTYFLAIDACKFRRMILPGDTLLLHCQLIGKMKFNTTATQSTGIAKVQGKIFVGEHLACEAILLAQIVKRHDA